MEIRSTQNQPIKYALAIFFLLVISLSSSSSVMVVKKVTIMSIKKQKSTIPKMFLTA